MVHVLVATDFSNEAEACLEYARTLAASLGKDNFKVTLLTVLEDIGQKSAQFQFALAMLDSHGVREELNKQAMDELSDLREKHLKEIQVDTVVLRAAKAVHLEIAEYAAAKQVNLIVIAAHTRSGIAPMIMGGVLEKLSREAPCPVVVIPAAK